MLSTKISEIMTPNVIMAESSTTIFAVMESMANNNVGGLVINEKQTPVGIFTEQDVLKRVMNRQLDLKKTSVKLVMTTPIRAVGRDTHIVEALGKMYRSKFRHLPVRGEKNAIVGMVSMRDILKLAVELGRNLADTQTIGSVISGNATTVDGSQSVHETIEIMIRQDRGCVIVTKDGRPQGIFTERDVLKRVAVKGVEPHRTPIKQVMTSNWLSMPGSALVGEVLGEMHRRDFRNMPILGERGELVGIVSMADVLHYARGLDIDETVRKTWKEIAEFWESEDQYTPG
jgi:CBS domain-containing protein